MKLEDLNLDDLSTEELMELQKTIKQNKMKRWRQSDDYIKTSIKRTLKSVEHKENLYGDDFLDDIFDIIQKMKKRKTETEE